MRPAFLPILIAGGIATTSAAAMGQAPPYDSVMEHLADQILGGGVASGRTSAAVAVFVRDGQIRFAKGYGLEDASTRSPVTPELTLIQIASITKTFTGLEIARLKQAGLIRSYDDPANLYLKSIHLPDWRGQPITIRELFTHTAGLDEAAFDVGGPTLPDKGFDAAAMQAGLPKLFRRPGDFPAYSNYGVDILGVLVADLMHVPYVDAVRRDILTPLRMTSSKFVTDGRAPPHLLHGFIPGTSERLTDEYPNANAAPSGGLLATPMDMGRYMIALLGKDASGAITEPMRRDMFTIQHQNAGETAAHGLLFEINPIGRKVLVQHGGSLGPHRCWMAFSFQRHAGIFYCHTTWDVAKHRGAIKPIPYLATAKTLLGALLAYDDPAALAPPNGGSPVWKPAWSTYLGRYETMRREHVGFGRLIAALEGGALPVVRTDKGLMIGDEGPAHELEPGVFTAGSDVFAFTRDPSGSGMVLTARTQPSAFERVRGLDDPATLRLALIVLLIAALTGLMFPLWSGGSRRRREAVLGALLFALALGGPTILVIVTDAFDYPYVWGVVWPIRTTQGLALLQVPALVLMVLALMGGPAAATPGLGARIGHIHLAALSIACVLALGVSLYLGVFSLYLN